MKFCIGILSLILSVSLFSQETYFEQPPEKVKESFLKLFPDVKTASWKKVKFGYEAGFSEQDRDIQVLFASGGELIKTETEITKEELPESAKEYLSRNHRGSAVKTARVNNSDGMVLYQARVNNNKTLIFSSSGSYLADLNDEEDEEEEEEEDDDDSDKKKQEKKKKK